MERVDSARRETKDAIQGWPSPLPVAPARRRRGRFRVAVEPERRGRETALFVWGVVMILGMGILMLLGMEMVQRLGETIAARSAAGPRTPGPTLPARWQFLGSGPDRVPGRAARAEEGEFGGGGDEGVRDSLRLLEGRVIALEKQHGRGWSGGDVPRD